MRCSWDAVSCPHCPAGWQVTVQPGRLGMAKIAGYFRPTHLAHLIHASPNLELNLRRARESAFQALKEDPCAENSLNVKAEADFARTFRRRLSGAITHSFQSIPAVSPTTRHKFDHPNCHIHFESFDAILSAPSRIWVSTR